MTHVIVEDDFPDHPKVIGLNDAAVACWLRGLCYASRYLSDGAIPRAALPKLGKPKAAAALVAAGLWEATESGWQVHDYAHVQRTKAEVDDLVAGKARAGTFGNHKRWHVRRNVVAGDCQWCRTSIAGAIGAATESATESVSQTDRETSPSPSPPPPPPTSGFKSSMESLFLRSDGEQRDPKVVEALRWLAEGDYQRRLDSGASILKPAAYLDGCLRTRIANDGDDLDRVAAELPDLTPTEMRDELEDRRFLA